MILRPGFWLPVLLFSFSFTSLSFPQNAPVTNAKEIKKNLLKNKQNLAEIQKKLELEKQKQRQAHAQEKNVLNRLQRVDQTLGKLRREKDINEQDLTETRIRLERLQDDMKTTQEELGRSREILKARLAALYRMNFRAPFLGGLLDSESFSDFARKLKFELVLAQSNEKLLSQTLLHEQRLEGESELWNNEQSRKQRILSVLGRQEKNYSKERVNREVFLTSIRKQQTARQQAIEELNDAAQELQSKVALLLQQARRAKKSSVYIPPSGKGITVKRGRIPWPVSGEILPDYSFGKHKNKEFNAVVDNSGVQIKAPLGTPIRAVAGGLVRYADWFKGYGKLVILDHGEGYYSLYAQADEISVSEGQEVAAGQVIGTVGDTGSLVGSSLYFEIRHNGIPQDPERWLARR